MRQKFVSNERMDDQELMEAIASGDGEAVALLVERYRRRIFKYLAGWMQNRDDALDLTQEVLLRVCRKAHTFSGQAPLTPWIFRIAKNMHIDNWRKRNMAVYRNRTGLKDQISSQEASRPAPTPEESAMGIEIVDRIRHEISRLPERQREVVQLRLLADLSLEEIAQASGLTVGGVKSTLHNALKNLRQQLIDVRRSHYVPMQQKSGNS